MPFLFADDTNIVATGYNLNYIISQINEETDNVYAWFKAKSFPLILRKRNYDFCAKMSIQDHKWYLFRKWLKQNFSASSLMMNWTGSPMLRILAKCYWMCRHFIKHGRSIWTGNPVDTVLYICFSVLSKIIKIQNSFIASHQTQYTV